MIKNFTVCGSNFRAQMDIDDEIYDEQGIYMEAATRALEAVFGDGIDAKVTFPDKEHDPNLGIIVQVYLTDDEKNEEKHIYVSSLDAAKNAGIRWLIEELEKFLKK